MIGHIKSQLQNPGKRFLQKLQNGFNPRGTLELLEAPLNAVMCTTHHKKQLLQHDLQYVVSGLLYCAHCPMIWIDLLKEAINKRYLESKRCCSRAAQSCQKNQRAAKFTTCKVSAICGCDHLDLLLFM